MRHEIRTMTWSGAVEKATPLGFCVMVSFGGVNASLNPDRPGTTEE